MRTRLLIPLLSLFVPRTYWTICVLPVCTGHKCSNRSQGKKPTASSLNSFLYAFVKEGKDAFMSVREGCRWSKAFLAMKCSLCCAIQLETILTVLFVGPGSTWWRGNNCAVRSREQAPTYIRFLALVLHHTSWHDYCDHLRNRVFFFLLDFSLPT